MLLVVDPQQVGRQSPQSQKHEVHRRAGRIDVSQVRLAELILRAQLGQLPAPFTCLSGGPAQHDDGDQQQEDGPKVRELPLFR